MRELKARSVPVAGIDRMVLTEQLAVMDLVALGQFLLLPEDDLTLATVLKSPLIGLDEEALFALAHGAGRRTLWTELKRARRRTRRLSRAPTRFSPSCWRRSISCRPTNSMPTCSAARGGRQALLARLGADAADPIDEFLDLALAYERSHAPSLQGFLHWLAAAPSRSSATSTRRPATRCAS